MELKCLQVLNDADIKIGPIGYAGRMHDAPNGPSTVLFPVARYGIGDYVEGIPHYSISRPEKLEPTLASLIKKELSIKVSTFKKDEERLNYLTSIYSKIDHYRVKDDLLFELDYSVPPTMEHAMPEHFRVFGSGFKFLSNEESYSLFIEHQDEVKSQIEKQVNQAIRDIIRDFINNYSGTKLILEPSIFKLKIDQQDASKRSMIQRKIIANLHHSLNVEYPYIKASYTQFQSLFNPDSTLVSKKIQWHSNEVKSLAIFIGALECIRGTGKWKVCQERFFIDGIELPRNLAHRNDPKNEGDIKFQKTIRSTFILDEE